jgi:hypothetical protein
LVFVHDQSTFENFPITCIHLGRWRLHKSRRLASLS